MAYYKNVASQKIPVYAYNKITGAAATGEAANISGEISKDGGTSAATNDAAPTELEATDHPGWYLFDMTQTEMNADLIIVTAVCSTTDVICETVPISTLPGTSAGVLADMVAISGDSTAADNAELAFDGTGYDIGGIDVSVLNTAATAVGSDGTGLTEVGLVDGALTNAKLAGNLEVVFETDFATNYDTTLDRWSVAARKQYDRGSSTWEDFPPNFDQLTIDGSGNITGNLTGNVDGSVGSVVGGVNTGSGVITTLDALDTAQDSQHGTTQTAITNLNDPTAAAIAAAIQAATVETGITLNEVLRVLLAGVAGLSDTFEGADAATAAHFRNLADDKNRITVNTDANGNRTSITYDLT